MAMIELNWHPTSRQLRQFGGLCLVLLPLVAWFWSASQPVVIALAGIGLLIFMTAWLHPKAISPLFVGLMLVTVPIGVVLGELAMLLIYLLVFLPIGIGFRLLRRDRLQLKLDRAAASYWQPKRPPRSVASYYRQF